MPCLTHGALTNLVVHCYENRINLGISTTLHYQIIHKLITTLAQGITNPAIEFILKILECFP